MNLPCDILTEPIILAGLGGFSYQLIEIVEPKLKNLPKRKQLDVIDIDYFLMIIRLFLALFVGYIYFACAEEVSRIVAVHIGITAPLILRALASKVPTE